MVDYMLATAMQQSLLHALSQLLFLLTGSTAAGIISRAQSLQHSPSGLAQTTSVSTGPALPHFLSRFTWPQIYCCFAFRRNGTIHAVLHRVVLCRAVYTVALRAVLC